MERYLKEYLEADTVRKSEILDTVTDVTTMHRKSVIRSFKRMQLKDPARTEKRGRPTYFTKDVDAALYTVWDTARKPCGELLFPLIQEYVPILIRDNMWKHGDEATSKLRAMKEHTVRRRVSAFMEKYGGGRGMSTTKPSHLKSIIPIFKGPWKDLPPGHGQLDTVAHCGSSLNGDFIYTVNYVDAATYWCIPRAQWNKGQEATKESIGYMRETLPCTLHELHPDSGSEFINWVLKDWCDDARIALSRSEPSKKNDNMYVEERNGHVVRRYLGYLRFDDKTLVPLLNGLYDVLTLYLNHFQVVRRTLTKTKVGAKYVRTYEKVPLTPYARMLEHPDVPQVVKDRLREEHDALNPLVLKEKIDTLLIEIINKQRDHGD